MCPSNESQTSLCGDHCIVSKGGENGGLEREGGGETAKINPLFAYWPPFNEVSEELTSLGKITYPIVITGFLLYSRSIISMLFLGHLGDIELAGGSLSIGFANITGYSVIKGLAMGMDPICGQAYGAKRWAILSQTYQKTLILLLLASIPISLLWLNMEPILLWLGQDLTITSTARIYITFSLPDLLGQAHLQPLMIFLRTQSLTTPLTLAATAALILHLPINYLLVVHLNLGVKGVALASTWTTLNLNLGLLVYLVFSKKALKPWDGLTAVGFFRGWCLLLKLAMPSVVSVCLEWWWYEVMLILCGLLSNPRASVAAMGILIQTTGLIYVFPSSISSGLSTRVGNELGAGRPTRAQWATKVGLAVATACGLSAFAFTTAVRNVWGKMFTSEPQILVLTSIALPIVGFCELGNCPQTAGCGVMMGSARATVGAHINFGAFYLIGLPVAAILGFGLKIGFFGLWFGLVAAQASCVFMMVRAIRCTDWKLQAERAKELTEAAEGENDDLEASLLLH
ncbi:protein DETOXIFICATION 53 [Magnolia sinica]|uniref:protein DETOXIFICATION 53 n=1 Tax=Magnolia sinica TaxID=86752 RepID=UPI0026593EE4|nr:protein DETOXIFICATION 53 [Magnolia sinica]